MAEDKEQINPIFYVREKLNGKINPYGGLYSEFSEFVIDNPENEQEPFFITFITSEEYGVLTVNELEVFPTEAGLGTRVLEYLREYAQKRNLQIRLRDVTAPGFFDSFNWLEPRETGEWTKDYGGREIIDYWQKR
jgi:hypothetical protein